MQSLDYLASTVAWKMPAFKIFATTIHSMAKNYTCYAGPNTDHHTLALLMQVNIVLFQTQQWVSVNGQPFHTALACKDCSKNTARFTPTINEAHNFNTQYQVIWESLDYQTINAPNMNMSFQLMAVKTVYDIAYLLSYLHLSCYNIHTSANT